MASLVDKQFWQNRIENRVREDDPAVQAPRRGLRGMLDRARASIGAERGEPYAIYRFRRLIKRYLPKRPDWSAVELGCAPGLHLLWLRKHLGYQIYGVDYMPVGVEETRDVFRRNGVAPENAILADMFDPKFQAEHAGRYDVVYSFSLIEHFDDTVQVARAHTVLLKPGGMLVVAVPNLRGWVYPMMAMFGRDHLKAHNPRVMNAGWFSKVFTDLGIERVWSGYSGMMQPFGVAMRHEKSFRGFVWKCVDKTADVCEHAMFMTLRGAGVETPLSPWVVFIGRKGANP